MKSVPICAVKQVIVVAGRKSWSITFATSKPGAIIRMEIKIGFTACLAHQVFSLFHLLLLESMQCFYQLQSYLLRLITYLCHK